MRRALGASGFRLARQLLAESLLLSAAGAVIGLLFARWGTSLLVSQLSTFRAVVTLDVPLDWRVLAFTAAVTIMTALVFGIAPALRAARVDPNDALKQQGRSLTGDGRRGLATASGHRTGGPLARPGRSGRPVRAHLRDAGDRGHRVRP